MKNALNTDETLRLAMTHSLDGGCKTRAVHTRIGVPVANHSPVAPPYSGRHCPHRFRRRADGPPPTPGSPTATAALVPSWPFGFAKAFCRLASLFTSVGISDPVRPGDERFKKLSNGVEGSLQRDPCHQTRDRQYRSHAYRRARSAISLSGLSLPNRIRGSHWQSGKL